MTERTPLTIQQWLSSLPPGNTPIVPGTSNHQSTPKATRGPLTREASFQSDGGSSISSSVESVLDLSKPDPEAVLLELGFGPPHNTNFISRIPPRFLHPSKLLKHIDINKLIEKQAELQLQFTNQKPNSVPQSPARNRPTTV